MVTGGFLKVEELILPQCIECGSFELLSKHDLERTRVAAEQIAYDLGFPVADIEDTSLAVQELISNAVLHGVIDSPKHEPAHVTIYRATDASWIGILVRDRGTGIAALLHLP